MTGGRVTVVPCGDPDGAHVEWVVDALTETYDVTVRVAEPRPLPDDAFDASREQYRAAPFLEGPGEGELGRLTVTDVDLFHEQKNYVFGLAAVDLAAVLSTYRLRGEGDDVTASRIRKQAVKQGGRILGLESCADCVLGHTPTVVELDASPATLCQDCRAELSGDLGADERATAASPGGRAVAPTKADIDAIERSGDSDADRKDVGDQVVDELASTARFVGWLAALGVSFLVVGAGLFWLVEDVVGVQLGSTGEYALLVVIVLLTIVVARELVSLGTFLVRATRT